MGALRFEGFTLDVEGRVLKRDNKLVPLRRQSLKVLAHLARRSGQVVTNRELIESCWDNPKQTNPNSLAQCIKDIREALGETDQPVIRTAARQGYVFAAPVSVMGGPPAPAAGHPAAGAAAPAAPSRPARTFDLPPWRGGRWHALAATLLLAGAAAVWGLWTWSNRPAEPTMMASPSIAVLPLKTMDSGGGKGGVHDGGLTDEIATELVRVPRGFPLLIRSAAAFKGKVVDPKTAGRELGVRYVAVGVMRREDRMARINVQLIETETGRQVWADLFDFALDEPGSQQRVAARIARLATNGLLRTESRRPLPPEPKPDHYAILGRAAMSGRLNAGINREAMLLFDKGKGLDEDSVAVLQGYARTRLLAVLNRWAPRDQRELWLDQAETAIGRIIHHRPRSYGAYRLRGTLFRARHDPEQAIKAFERALELNSSYSHAYAELGRTRLEMGLANVTIEGVKKAVSISPTDPDIHEWYLWAGEAEVHQENYREALHWLQKAHGADPDYDRAVLWLAIAEVGLGRREKGLSLMAKYRAQDPDFTISAWSEDYPRSHPVVAAQRERIAQVLRELGVPEGDLQTGSTR